MSGTYAIAFVAILAYSALKLDWTANLKARLITILADIVIALYTALLLARYIPRILDVISSNTIAAAALLFGVYFTGYLHSEIRRYLYRRYQWDWLEHWTDRQIRDENSQQI